jgi:tetratricopeptide (TPR) repeat protein
MNMSRKFALTLALAIPLCCLCAVSTYFLPPVHDRLAWRIDELVLLVKYKLNPPEKEVFVPQQQATATLAAAPFQSTPTPPPTPPGENLPAAPSPTPAPTLPPEPTSKPTLTTTPLPDRVELTGVRYEDQHGRYNYCAPANLSMALSFWGWKGNRDVVGPFLKPDSKDKNVMPYEMVDYITAQTELSVTLRLGGDLDLLRRFLAAGYPILIEKGTYLRDLSGVVSWMGHYLVITGYDQTAGYFIAQDSYIGPDQKVPYAEMLSNWRAFNYTYLIIYSPDKEAEVTALLGPDADETANAQNAALKAANEIFGLSGIDQYFAWFNRGSSLVALDDYAGAAAAYDEAFKVYPTIPEAERPWRMLWYQTGPYKAYFYSQRYFDTLYLADGTLNAMQSDKNLEESYYWRGMARAALGDTPSAIADFRLALKFHPGFEPALYQLRALGVENP